VPDAFYMKSVIISRNERAAFDLLDYKLVSLSKIIN